MSSRSGYPTGEKGRCFPPYHRTFTSSTSLRGEIEHVFSVRIGGSSFSTHQVWKHTWRFATYNLSQRLVVSSCADFSHEIIIQSHKRPDDTEEDDNTD